jgi:hypothetical protein
VDHNFFAPLRLCEREKKKNKSRKVGKAQRQSAAAESHTEWTTISLRLCALARRKKEKIIGAPQFCGAGSRNSSGQVAKTPSRKESAAAEGKNFSS